MMKHFWAVLILVVIMAFAMPFGLAKFKVPAYQGFVNDYSNVLSAETKTILINISKELKEKTGAEIAVVTIDTIGDTPIEEAGLEIGRQWGVGSKKENTGLLMLFVIKDRKMRTEVGYGLEGILTDGTTGEVRDKIFVPHFRQGDYDGGILQGTAFYAKRIADAYQVQLDSLSGNYVPVEENNSESDSERPPPLAIFIIFGILILFIALNHNRRNRNGMWGGGMGGFGGFGGGGFGGGGFGGGGGGFGGFGGGGFGGGGSSGNW